MIKKICQGDFLQRILSFLPKALNKQVQKFKENKFFIRNIVEVKAASFPKASKSLESFIAVSNKPKNKKLLAVGYGVLLTHEMAL